MIKVAGHTPHDEDSPCTSEAVVKRFAYTYFASEGNCGFEAARSTVVTYCFQERANIDTESASSLVLRIMGGFRLAWT